jgi:hypothetical protein
VTTRLIFASLNMLDGQVAQLAFLFDHRRRAGVAAAAEQGIEPASQSTFLRGRHAYS